MKRLYQLVAVAAVTFFIPVAVSVPASAEAVCEIGFTGPDSNNMCVSKEQYRCSVTNTNNVTITNSSNQTVASGQVSVSGNGTGGSGTSGSVTNSNGATFTVTIKNGDDSNQNICTALLVVPATETPGTPGTPGTPATPPSGGRGGASEPVRPAQTVIPAALPVTSGGKAPALALVGSVALTAAAVYVYRRLIS